MCSADSVRAERTKVAKTSVSVGQKYSCLTVIVFCGLWTSYALCVEAYKAAEPFRWTVVPSTAGGPGGDGKKKDITVGRFTVIVLAFTCFEVRSLAATGAEEGWKCPSEQGSTDDGGAGRELTTTLRLAMNLQAPFFLLFLLAVVGLPALAVPPYVMSAMKKVQPCGEVCLRCLILWALIGVQASWADAVEVVFGKTGIKCDDING
eukprot:COSAG03_NODE_10435_length_651_cov_1.202899_1_plen_205_part_10